MGLEARVVFFLLDLSGQQGSQLKQPLSVIFPLPLDMVEQFRRGEVRDHHLGWQYDSFDVLQSMEKQLRSVE